MSIEIRNVAKSFGSFQAVKDVSVTIPTGELVALLGPSGSGKTTLLRMIAGLEGVDSGELLIRGEDFQSKPLGERKVGFVFQHYALFRHMTIFDNIAFGLQVRTRKRRPSKAEIRERVHELLSLVQLEGLADRYPSQLSGGQRQRVALARALAIEPEVLLLDEPFGALDAKVRQELRRWLRELHDKLHITTVFVTHDQEEALEMADRVVVMNQGKVEQIGTPAEVYHSPLNPFVYSFLGRVNSFPGRVANGRLIVGDTEVELSPGTDVHSVEAVGFIRPHEIELSRRQSQRTPHAAVVQQISAVGPTIRLALKRLETGEGFEAELSIERYRELGAAIGETVYVDLRNVNIYVKEPHKQSARYEQKLLAMQSVADV